MTAPTSSDNDTTSSIEEQIVAASPILEAYGNAKTVMNNNSSRFGKFTKLLYSVPANTQTGNILGSSLETYLLEKSRVVFQALNERNYHIFYFLHEGLGHNNKEFGLATVDKFHYSNQGKCFQPMRDGERFRELQDSLNTFRIGNEVQKVLWKITAGVLNLGNVNFMRSGDGYANIDKKSMKYVDVVANLWGIKASELEKRLTTKSLKDRTKFIEQKIQFDDAVSNRDSIAKGIYENIFLWLAKRINAELLVEDDDEEEEGKTDGENDKYFIGILDVFGFENFYFNSLEQFCINYTNEKLQQFFNHHIIASEQEEYLRESIVWTPLTVPDNAPYFELVEPVKTGFFTLLDSACQGPSKDDTTAFLQFLDKKHANNKSIKMAKKPGSGNWRGKKDKSKRRFEGFVIEHYADRVTYDGAEFLIKNMESVHADTAKMIKKSESSIFKEINIVKGGGRKKKKKKSVTSVFYGGIKRLMKSLKQTEPYFVRCINPNKQKSSEVWTESIVEHQLRCGGLLEALKVLKLGYPTRVPYNLLYEKYHSAVDNPLIKNMKPRDFTTSLMIAFDVERNDYELGLTKIFFKPARAAILEVIMAKAGEPLTKEQNDKITAWFVRKRCTQILGTAKAFTFMRKIVRMKRAAKEWREKGRVVSMLGGSVMKHLIIARAAITKRKREEAAVALQTYFRSCFERNVYKKHVEKVKKATKVIQIAYDSMRYREALKNWTDAKVEQRKVAEKRLDIEQEPNVSVPAAAAMDIPITPIIKTLSSPNNEEEVDGSDKDDLRMEIEVQKIKQKQGSLDLDKQKEKEKDHQKTIKKKQHDKLAEQNKIDRQKQDENASTTPQPTTTKKKKRKKKRRKSTMIGGYPAYNPDIDSGEDEYNSDNGIEEVDFDKLLAKFPRLAAYGQLFYRHAGSMRRHKPQDRVVTVSFDQIGRPKQISWGSGSRFIWFKDILYISWGHNTPVFEARKQLDPAKCFSIVSKPGTILDLEGHSELDAELWVKGLRRMIGHSNEKSDDLAQRNKAKLIQNAEQKHNEQRKPKRDIDEIMKLQQDLFVMTYHTVMRKLNEERVWNIDDETRELFAPQIMYPIVLKDDIPWRGWEGWLREKVTTHCRQRMQRQQQQQHGNVAADDQCLMM